MAIREVRPVRLPRPIADDKEILNQSAEARMFGLLEQIVEELAAIREELERQAGEPRPPVEP